MFVTVRRNKYVLFYSILEDVVSKLACHATNDTEKKNLAELRLLRCLRPCVYPDGILRIEGRLDQAPIPTDERHLIVLPSRHYLTRLLILHCHEECAHGGDGRMCSWKDSVHVDANSTPVLDSQSSIQR